MADVTDVPGPPVDVDDEFVLIGAQGERADRGSRTLARTRTTNSWEVVTAMARAAAPGVPCRVRTGRVCGRSPG